MSMPDAPLPNAGSPYPMRLHPRVLVGYGSLLGAVMVVLGIGWAHPRAAAHRA